MSDLFYTPAVQTGRGHDFHDHSINISLTLDNVWVKKKQIKMNWYDNVRQISLVIARSHFRVSKMNRNYMNFTINAMWINLQ